MVPEAPAVMSAPSKGATRNQAEISGSPMVPGTLRFVPIMMSPWDIFLIGRAELKQPAESVRSARKRSLTCGTIPASPPDRRWVIAISAIAAQRDDRERRVRHASETGERLVGLLQEIGLGPA